MSLWEFYFGWYQGAVYSNLLASGICAGLVWWRARVHLRHVRAKDKAELDQALAGHHQAVASAVAQQLAEHHAAVLAAVAAPQEGATDE